jgi:hypothetical protein
MRSRLTALAAFAAGAAGLGTLTPHTATAQAVVESYSAQGCARGVVRYDQSGGPATPVTGNVLCVSGPVQLERRVFGGGSADEFRFTGSLSPTFGTEFAGSSVAVEAALFGFTGPRPDGSAQAFSMGLGAFSMTPAFMVGQTGASTFFTRGAPVRPETVFASLRDVRGGFSIFYALPGRPGGGSERTELSLTLTPIPEPSTFALGAAGLGAVGAAARRRRRPA